MRFTDVVVSATVCLLQWVFYYPHVMTYLMRRDSETRKNRGSGVVGVPNSKTNCKGENEFTLTLLMPKSHFELKLQSQKAKKIFSLEYFCLQMQKWQKIQIFWISPNHLDCMCCSIEISLKKYILVKKQGFFVPFSTVFTPFIPNYIIRA